MSKPSGVLARNSGRILLTLADVITIVAPPGADWNASHIFNKQWPSHARFHGAVGLGSAMGLASFGMAQLWLRTRDPATSRDIAAAVPLAYWGAFFPAALVKGAGVDDEPHHVARIMGVPANLFYAALTSALAVGGWLLDRRNR